MAAFVYERTILYPPRSIRAHRGYAYEICSPQSVGKPVDVYINARHSGAYKAYIMLSA